METISDRSKPWSRNLPALEKLQWAEQPSAPTHDKWFSLYNIQICSNLQIKASSMLQLMNEQMSLLMNLCEIKTFWAFNSTQIMHMLVCISCFLILRTLKKCYCVKCSKISPISFFYVSQGSVATHLRCGGQCGMVCVANLTENTTVKKFWKSAQHLSKLWRNV